MKFKNDEEKRNYYRQLGSKGGRATVERHGRAHMQTIGKKGFEQTGKKYFRSMQEYKLWLASLGSFVYWRDTGLPPKYDRTGNPIFPTNKPLAPWDDDYTEF